MAPVDEPAVPGLGFDSAVLGLDPPGVVGLEAGPDLEPPVVPSLTWTTLLVLNGIPAVSTGVECDRMNFGRAGFD